MNQPNQHTKVNKHTAKLAEEQMLTAFKRCYVTAQKAVLNEIMKAEGDEKKEWQQLRKQLGEQYQETLNQLQ